MLVRADATIVEIPNALRCHVACVVALPFGYKQNGFNGFLYCFHEFWLSRLVVSYADDGLPQTSPFGPLTIAQCVPASFVVLFATARQYLPAHFAMITKPFFASHTATH